MEKPVNISYKNSGIYGFVHEPDDIDAVKTRIGLLLIHGQGGNKTGHKRSFVELGRYFEKKQIITLRIDLLGEGESEELLEDRYLSWRGLIPAVNFFYETYSLHKLILLGDCFGGLLSAYFAKLEPKIDKVIIWNLQQMKWSDELLKGFNGLSNENLLNFQTYIRKLVLKETWIKFFTLQMNFSRIWELAIIKPIKSLLKSYFKVFKSIRIQSSFIRDSKKNRDSLVLNEIKSMRKDLVIKIIHSSTIPNGDKIINVSRFVFKKINSNAEHFLISGIPFSKKWKESAIHEIENWVIN